MAAAVVVQQLALSSLMWYFINCSDDFHGTMVLAHVVSMTLSLSNQDSTVQPIK